MPLSPAFLEARAAEQRRRLIAYLPIAEPITLVVRGRPVPVAVVHLTQRIRSELGLAENAFLAGLAPLRGDVFQLLWRLSPAWRRPLRPMWLRVHPSRRARPLPRWRSLLAYGWHAGWAHARLGRLVDRCDLRAAEAGIARWIEGQYQDEPARPVVGSAPAEVSTAPARCGLDAVCQHFATWLGIDPLTVPDVPIPLLHQWHRDWLIATGRSEAVIDPSTELAPAP